MSTGPERIGFLDPDTWSRLAKAAVVVPIVCYVVGFLVATHHLGTLGATAFDVLRVRYLVIGLVFLLFAASIVGPLLVTLKQLGNGPVPSLWRAVFIAFRNGVLVYVLLYYLIIFMNVSAGVSSSGSDSVPGGIAEILRHVRSPILSLAVWSAIAVIALWAIVTVFWVVRRIWCSICGSSLQQNGDPTTLGGFVRKHFWTFRYWRTVGVIGSGWAGMFLIMSLTMVGSTVTSHVWEIGIPDLNSGWTAFVVIAAIVYLSQCALLIQSSPPAGSDRIASMPTYSLPVVISLRGFTVVFILLAAFGSYVSYVFPLLPQQLGGGAPIPVTVQIDGLPDVGQNLLQERKQKLLLVDKSETRLLLLIESADRSRTLIEVPLESVTWIKYGHAS